MSVPLPSGAVVSVLVEWWESKVPTGTGGGPL